MKTTFASALFVLFSVALTVLVPSSPALAQSTHFISRVNWSAGFEYKQLDYYGENVLYSPGGGGLGLEFGFARNFLPGLEAYATVGFQWQFAYRTNEECPGHVADVDETKFSFGRYFATVGMNQYIGINRGPLPDIIVGGGVNFNVPIRMRMTENNKPLGNIRYDQAQGYHVDVKMRFSTDREGVFIEPGLRYRHLELNASEYAEGDVSILPDYLQNVNARGIELSLTIVKVL